MQLFRSTLPRLNEGDGARLKSTIKDAEPGVRGDSNPAARPGLFTAAAAAPPVTGAQLPPLCVCASVGAISSRGKNFLSVTAVVMCACVFEWDPAIASKGGKMLLVQFFWTLFLWVKL